MSRIHVSIGYARHDDSAREEIWESLFTKLLDDQKKGGLEIRYHYIAKQYVQKNDEIKKLEWNGREIRNGTCLSCLLGLATPETLLTGLLPPKQPFRLPSRLPFLMPDRKTKRVGRREEKPCPRSKKSTSVKWSACQLHSEIILPRLTKTWKTQKWHSSMAFETTNLVLQR